MGKMLSEYRRILDVLENAFSSEPVLLQDMIRHMRRIMDHVLRKNHDLKEEVGKIMGGKVLPLPSDALRE